MIIKVFLSYLLILFFSTSLFSQDIRTNVLKDTTIFLDELVFNSEKEEELFKSIYLDESNDYFSLIFLVKKGVNTSGINDARSKLYKKIDSFRAKNVKSKGEKKSVKIIYNNIHKEFFTKYELINHFDDVFSKGYYNCLSATFLYGLVLEELEIPYQINVLPNHVNLTAFPKTHQILLETTDPVNGYFSFDKKFKEKYVESLLTNKLIEISEVESNSIDQLFEKYYYSDEVLDLKELIGAQYYNDGLYLMQEDKSTEAIQQLEKSIALYPSINAGLLVSSLYYSEIAESNYSNRGHLAYLIKLLRYKELGFNLNGVKYELTKAADYYLTTKDDTTVFKQIYEELHANIKEDSLNIDLEVIYLLSLGNYHLKQLNHDVASDYYAKILHLKEETKTGIEELYVLSVIYHVDNFSDKQKALAYLISAEETYDKLLKNKAYMTYKSEVLSWLMMEYFEKNDLKNGEKYRADLEVILDTVDIKINENNIGIAYAKAGACYFRRGSRTRAKIMFKKGLEYSPGNYELESRLRMLNY